MASDYPPVAVGRLREVAARLAELRYGGGEAGRWLLNLVAEYSSGARLGLRLDEATGLIPKPGHSPWWVIEDREHRDELLRESAGRLARPVRGRRPDGREIVRSSRRRTRATKSSTS